MSVGTQIWIVFVIYFFGAVAFIPVFRRFRVNIQNRAERESLTESRMNNFESRTPLILKSLAEVDTLGAGLSDRERGTEFEKYVRDLFNQTPNITAYIARDYAKDKGIALSGQDQGIDVIIERFSPDHSRTHIATQAVQCKLYQSAVGNKAIQEALAGANIFGAFSHDPKNPQRAIVITNNYFTKPAQDLAKANDIRLINRDELGEMIFAIKTFRQPNPSISDTEISESSESDFEDVS